MEPVGEIKMFLETHVDFELNPANGKVKCKLTGHEMPCNITVLQSYVSGKKYQRLTGKGTYSIENCQEYRQYLKPVQGKSGKLFCTLTRRTITDSPACIQRHVEGKRFRNAVAKAINSQSQAHTVNMEQMDCVEDDKAEEAFDYSLKDSKQEQKGQNTAANKPCQSNGTRKKQQKNKTTKSKACNMQYNPDDEGAEVGDEELDAGTVVLWVPSDYEFEEEDDDPWAGYFDKMEPCEKFNTNGKSHVSSKSINKADPKSRKRKVKSSFELSYAD